MIGFEELFGLLMVGWFGVLMLCCLWAMVGLNEQSDAQVRIWMVVVATDLALALLTAFAGLILWAVLHVRVV